MDGHVGGYPIKFLEQIVRLSKCLKKKRELIGSVRDLNAQGEKRRSFGDNFHEDFQRRYASNVLELSSVNRDLNEHLKNIQEFTQEVCSSITFDSVFIESLDLQFAPEVGPTISLPNIIREGCQEDAYDMVNKNNTTEEKECVENPRVLSLVSSLTSLMCILHRLADGERYAFFSAIVDFFYPFLRMHGKNPRKLKCRFFNTFLPNGNALPQNHVVAWQLTHLAEFFHFLF